MILLKIFDSQAVYHYIPNPLETLPFIPKCEFEIGGSQDFIGEQNRGLQYSKSNVRRSRFIHRTHRGAE
jgi:hypothetical protein